MVLRGVPMSQIDLQKLTKKKPRVYPFATQQFIKDGKTDAEIKAILRKLFLKSLRSKPRVDTRSSTAHQLTGLYSFTVKSNTKKSIQKKMTIQNS